MRNLLFLLTLVLVACGPDGKHIAIDGRFLNLNQGEFLVYSPDGAIEGVDTIRLEGGRFDYEAECQHDGTTVVVLPNGQEIPVFVSPGKSYTIKGDAQNLNAVVVKGGGDNKLMNKFREEIAEKAAKAPAGQAADPDAFVTTDNIKQFVESNPASAVSKYLVRRYLLGIEKADYKTAALLIDKMLKASPDDAVLKVLQRRVNDLKNTSAGCAIPSFSVTDINGATVSNGTISSGIWLVCTFATWDYESTNLLRRIKTTKTDKSADWNILAISFDASKTQCRNSMSYDADEYTIICDEKMLETPLADKFSVRRTSAVIIVKDGKIIERNLIGEKLIEYLRDKL